MRRIAPAGPVEPPPVERIDPRALLGPEPVLVPGSPAGVVVALWVIVVLKLVGAVAPLTFVVGHLPAWTGSRRARAQGWAAAVGLTVYGGVLSVAAITDHQPAFGDVSRCCGRGRRSSAGGRVDGGRSRCRRSRR